jgi:hypothetical protein
MRSEPEPGLANDLAKKASDRRGRISVGPSGADFNDLDAAIKLARAGATIVVATGEYGAVEITRKVRLVAANGSMPSIRSLDGANAVVINADCEIRGFRIQSTRQQSKAAVYVEGASLKLRQVDIVVASGTGPAIRVKGPSSMVDVADCRLETAASDGIEVLEGSHATVSRTRVRADGGTGINASGTASAVTLDRVEIQDSETGVRIHDRAALVGQRLEVTRCGSGVRIDAAKAQLNHASVDESRRTGIVVGGTGVLELQSSKVRDNGNHGLEVQDRRSRVRVSSNLWSGNQESGIHARAGAEVDLANDHFQENGRDGIDIWGPFTAVSGKDCTFSANYEDGVRLRNGCIAKFEGSKILNNGGRGISVAGRKALLEASGSTISGNRGVGISVEESASLSLRSSSVAANLSNGIDVTGAVRVLIEGVKIQNNGGNGVILRSFDAATLLQVHFEDHRFPALAIHESQEGKLVAKGLTYLSNDENVIHFS